jgi:hypothetical protein
VISRLGLQINEYKKRAKDFDFLAWREVGDALRASDDFKWDRIESVLNEALVAFDYPQFDEYMPAYSALVRSKSGNGEIVVDDKALLIDVCYACERADRIGMMYGVMVHSVPPDENKRMRGSVLMKKDKKISEMVDKLFHNDGSFVRRFLGDAVRRSYEEENDLRSRIRMGGKIIETEKWLSTYPIVLV